MFNNGDFVKLLNTSLSMAEEQLLNQMEKIHI